MIAKCSRCKRERLMDNVRKRLCSSCRTSISDHKKRVKGEITEEQRERSRIYFKKYYEKNKEKHKQHMKNYQRLKKVKKKNKSRGTSAWIRDEILDHYGHKCKECNSEDNLEIHHEEYGKNNKSILKNLDKFVFVFCRLCHRKHHRLENTQNRKY